jgi:hypothetical protein
VTGTALSGPRPLRIFATSTDQRRSPTSVLISRRSGKSKFTANCRGAHRPGCGCVVNPLEHRPPVLRRRVGSMDDSPATLSGDRETERPALRSDGHWSSRWCRREIWPCRLSYWGVDRDILHCRRGAEGAPSQIFCQSYALFQGEFTHQLLHFLTIQLGIDWREASQRHPKQQVIPVPELTVLHRARQTLQRVKLFRSRRVAAGRIGGRHAVPEVFG